MKSFFLLTLPLLATDKTYAQFIPPFLPLNSLFSTSALRNEVTKCRIKTMRATKDGGKTSSNFPNPLGEGTNLEHAHDCADHFGKCSVQEIEEMRDGETFLLVTLFNTMILTFLTSILNKILFIRSTPCRKTTK